MTSHRLFQSGCWGEVGEDVRRVCALVFLNVEITATEFCDFGNAVGWDASVLMKSDMRLAVTATTP